MVKLILKVGKQAKGGEVKRAYFVKNIIDKRPFLERLFSRKVTMFSAVISDGITDYPINYVDTVYLEDIKQSLTKSLKRIEAIRDIRNSLDI